MKRFLQSEAGATVMWVLSSMLLAAVIVPWICRAGTNLGEAAATKDLPAVLEWLGRSAAGAKFSRYYSRSLSLSALILLPFLFRRLRRLRARSLWIDGTKRPVGWRCGWVQSAVGVAVAGGLLWVLGILLHHWGAYVPAPKAPGIGKLFWAAAVPAVGASLVEEWLFRGLLLGLWLRFARPLCRLPGHFAFFRVHPFHQTSARLDDCGPDFAMGGLRAAG